MEDQNQIQQQSASNEPTIVQQPETAEPKEKPNPNDLKTKGNNYFSQQDYNQAIDCYEDALEIAIEIDDKQLAAILLQNIAISYSKLKDDQSVILYATRAIEMNASLKKPYLFRSKAYENTEKYEEALEDLKKAQELDPNDKQIASDLIRLKKKYDEDMEKKKNEALSGLKQLGNTLLGKFGLSLDNFKLNQNENGSYNVSYQQ